jgi:hypothetical protein
MKFQKPVLNRIGNYLSVSLGAGCLAGNADAATVVTFYGAGSQSSASSTPTPAGLDVANMGYEEVPLNRYLANDSQSAWVAFSASSGYLTNGTVGKDHAVFNSYGYGQYLKNGRPIHGAALNHHQNYATISFDGGGVTALCMAGPARPGDGPAHGFVAVRELPRERLVGAAFRRLVEETDGTRSAEFEWAVIGSVPAAEQAEFLTALAGQMREQCPQSAPTRSRGVVRAATLPNGSQRREGSCAGKMVQGYRFNPTEGRLPGTRNSGKRMECGP